jgi:hypothetical protein
MNKTIKTRKAAGFTVFFPKYWDKMSDSEQAKWLLNEIARMDGKTSNPSRGFIEITGQDWRDLIAIPPPAKYPPILAPLTLARRKRETAEWPVRPADRFRENPRE